MSDFWLQRRSGVRKGKRWHGTDHIKSRRVGGEDQRGWHALSVDHDPGSRVTTHHVMLNRIGDDGVLRQVTLTHHKKNADTTVASSDDTGVSHAAVAAPSPDLIALIESHHTNAAWMPLLDALAEEYPEHFESAVAEHTRARSESDATHYARAVSATLSATR